MAHDVAGAAASLQLSLELFGEDQAGDLPAAHRKGFDDILQYMRRFSGMLEALKRQYRAARVDVVPGPVEMSRAADGLTEDHASGGAPVVRVATGCPRVHADGALVAMLLEELVEAAGPVPAGETAVVLAYVVRSGADGVAVVEFNASPSGIRAVAGGSASDGDWSEPLLRTGRDGDPSTARILVERLGGRLWTADGPSGVRHVYFTLPLWEDA
ncbi:MAG: hypothetical protein AB7G23_04345 [Vicinamibacterales bacterium]